MKVIELIDLIQDFFANDTISDQKAEYHPSIIRGHLNNVYNQAVYNTYLTGKRDSDFSQLDAWSRTYTCDVLNQKGTHGYAFLPFAPVQLPDGMGVRQIRNHEAYTSYGAAIGAEWIFAPIEATANVVFAELEVSTMDDTPTFRLEQNNLATGEGEESHMLKLDKLPLAPLNIVQIDVLMIVPLEQMGLFDDIALPSGAEEMLTQQVIELLTHKPPSDTLNDGEPAINTPQ